MITTEKYLDKIKKKKEMSYLTVMGDGCVTVHKVTKMEFAEAAKELADINDCEISELDESEVYEHILFVRKGYKSSQVDWMETSGEPEIVIH